MVSGQTANAGPAGARRVVFADRDGVLNRAVVIDGRPYPPPDPEAFELLPGVVDAVAALRAAGFLVVVATNQPDIAAGRQSAAAVAAMHDRLRRETGVDDIRVCPHVDADGCACRKPKPGMLLDAAAAFGVDPAQGFMIGDRWRDVEAGAAAGCKTFFIDYGYHERGPSVPPDYAAASFAEAARMILSITQTGS